jgi:hypothetical protein
MDRQPARDTAISGLTLRPLRDVDDAARIVAIDTGSAARDRVDPLSTLEDVPALDARRDVVRQALAGPSTLTPLYRCRTLTKLRQTGVACGHCAP